MAWRLFGQGLKEPYFGQYCLAEVCLKLISLCELSDC